MEKDNRLLEGARQGVPPTMKRILLVSFIYLLSMSIGELFANVIWGTSISRGGAWSEYIIYLELLLRYGIAMLMVFFFVRRVDGRSIRTLGFYRGDAIKQYIKGALLAGIGLTIIWNILRASGQIDVTFSLETTLQSMLPGIIIIVATWIVQGASEEVLLRGYILPNLSEISSLYTAILTSSIIFAVMHIGNAGITFISLFNILLCGLLLGLLVVKQQSIWGACGFHTVWNLLQGNVFGIAVSGINLPGTVWQSTYATPTLLNGGVFGMEGSLLTTLFMTLVIMGIVISMRRELLLEGQSL